MTDPTSERESPWPRRRAYAELFLISFVILFFELTCIRWFGSTVVFLTFFTNLVLMACFLGMTVGCLAASRRRDFVNLVLPLTLLAAVLAYGVLWGYNRYGSVTIDVGGQKSPQEVFFGTEIRPSDPSRFVIPIEAIAGIFYALIALVFVGLGQTMGRRFNALPNRVLAYTTNVLGSLIGIVAFGAVSWFRLPPLVWFAVGSGLLLIFTSRWRALQAVCLAALLALVTLGAHALDAQTETTWSPYYKVQFDKKTRNIYVNNIIFQGMMRLDRAGLAYTLPYFLNRDAGGHPFDEVLVIGAGSGNDVEAALEHGARHVDAVEIDPRIYEIGREHHPNRPYSDPRVTIHLDDGRSFVHKTDRKYDLIVYALLDSLALHSGYSSLRLESFLFTEQAFREIKAKLKPDGVFAMYNFYRQGWVVGRLQMMAETVFGSRPIVISLPYQERITPADRQGSHVTFLLVGNTEAPVVAAIRRMMEEKRFFWAHSAPKFNESVNAYGGRPAASFGVDPEEWKKIGLAELDTRGITRTPTDNWPFLYLREPIIPALTVRGMVIVAVLSLAILFLFAPERAVRPNGRMFFLGAGFMLLETKGVVHMALLFGSTWVVNSIVFFAILVMVLLSNLHVLLVRPRRLWPAYVLLIAALLVNASVPMTDFLALPGSARVVVSCLVVFLPVYFAGLIFAASFRDSRQPDVDFGSNIGGVILGGLSENLSLIVGFNHLLYLAIVYYLLSAVLKPRLPAP
jgi:SAM-dependent methyltransferase